MATTHSTISDPTQIKVTTEVSMIQTIGAGPSTRETQIIQQEYNVPFVGYSQGVRKVATGVSDDPLIQGQEFILIESDHPIDITYNAGTAVTIAGTKRFSYESQTPCTVTVSNSSGEVASVRFVTASD